MSTFKVYTAQLNVGKVLKHSRSILFMDITIRTANTWIEQFFAPTAEMLSAYKYGKLSWDEYVEQYNSLMGTRLYTNADGFKAFEIINRIIEQYSSVVLGCYCGDVDKCHRKLAAMWFQTIARGKVSPGREIKSADVTIDTRVTTDATMYIYVQDYVDGISIPSITESVKASNPDLWVIVPNLEAAMFEGEMYALYLNGCDTNRLIIYPDHMRTNHCVEGLHRLDAVGDMLRQTTICYNLGTFRDMDTLNSMIERYTKFETHVISDPKE